MWKKNANDDTSQEQKSQSMITIKTIVTVIVIALVAIVALNNWNSDGGYIFEIKTDEDYTWACTISDSNIAKITDEKYESGKYYCRIEGINPGDVDVTLIRYKKGSPNDIAEKRVYKLKVAKGNLIMQKSVSREVY